MKQINKYQQKTPTPTTEYVRRQKCLNVIAIGVDGLNNIQICDYLQSILKIVAQE